MREELLVSACDMASAPVSSILQSDRFNSVRAELDKSACAMAAAPVYPI